MRNIKLQKTAYILGIVLFLIVLIFVLNDRMYDPMAPFVGSKLMKPSISFVMGTDHLGRDVFSRLLYASGITIGLSCLAVLLAMFVGTVMGMLAGFHVFPILTPIILFIGQISVVFPIRWLPMIVVALFGNGSTGMVLSMFFALWGQFLWIIYDEARALRGRGFIKAAYLLGGTKWKMIRMHVLPHMIPITLILGTFSFRTAIGILSTLSFLGIGLQPPIPTWGLMIAEGHPYFLQAWWTVFFPTLALACSVLAVNAFGNRLEHKWKRPDSNERQELTGEHTQTVL